MWPEQCFYNLDICIKYQIVYDLNWLQFLNNYCISPIVFSYYYMCNTKISFSNFSFQRILFLIFSPKSMFFFFSVKLRLSEKTPVYKKYNFGVQCRKFRAAFRYILKTFILTDVFITMQSCVYYFIQTKSMHNIFGKWD